MSTFVNALIGLIDETEIFTRKQWCEYLRVSPSAITHWTKGNSIPQPFRLRRIMSKVENCHTDVAREKFRAFSSLLDLPISTIATQSQKFQGAETLSEYIVRPLEEQLIDNLNKLPHLTKLQVIESSQAMISKELE